MIVNETRALPVGRLRTNASANPKRPMGKKYKDGLRACLEDFGFTGTLAVAENADGTYEVLDGTTRIEELEREAVKKVPCSVVAVCKEGLPDWQALRTEFRLAFDRHRKQYDEEAAAGQLQALAEKGREVARLATLAGKANLERLLGQRAAPAADVPMPAPKAQAMASLVLYGLAEDVTAIKGLLKQVKGKLLAGKARLALAQAVEFLDWEEEKVLTVLLATVARYSEAEHGTGTQAETIGAEGATGQSRQTAA